MLEGKITSGKPYQSPISDLEDRTMAFAFSTLNFWRKAYIITIWLVTIPFSIYFTWACVNGISGLTPIYLFIPGFLLPLTAWKHYAISKRKLSQIYWIAFFSLVPLMSLVGFLIMLSIARVTKNELQPKS